MLTLRQIEVIRALMTSGIMTSAATILNVSTPGISRLIKHTGSSLGIRLFVRHRGRYVPTPEARAQGRVFVQRHLDLIAVNGSRRRIHNWKAAAPLTGGR